MQTALYIAEALLTLVGALYVLGPLMPSFFMDFLSLDDGKDYRHRRLPPLMIVKGIFVAVAVGVFMYHAAKGLFHLIPGDWQTRGEDGDPFMQTRTYLTGFVALFATALILSYTERRVRQLHELDQQEEATKRKARGITDE